MTAQSCRAPSHYYSVAAVEKAFAAHGVQLSRGVAPGEENSGKQGSIPRAFETGALVALIGPQPGGVRVLVVTRQVPLWLDKLALDCGAPRHHSHNDSKSFIPSETFVLGNVEASLYRPNAAAAVKAALEGLQ